MKDLAVICPKRQVHYKPGGLRYAHADCLHNGVAGKHSFERQDPTHRQALAHDFRNSPAYQLLTGLLKQPRGVSTGLRETALFVNGPVTNRAYAIRDSLELTGDGWRD